jgi:hypothetical protein
MPGEKTIPIRIRQACDVRKSQIRASTLMENMAKIKSFRSPVILKDA